MPRSSISRVMPISSSRKDSSGTLADGSDPDPTLEAYYEFVVNRADSNCASMIRAATESPNEYRVRGYSSTCFVRTKPWLAPLASM